MISTVLGVTLAIIVVEGGVACLVYWLRNSCPWLIVRGDLNPKIDLEGLQRFFEHGWDSQLGWVRKANTSHDEVGQGGQRAHYQIDKTGARHSPGYEDIPPTVLAYGDSYTFCRQVNDADTWPHQLSNALGVRVDNRGVGNYGLDQALMRLEREFDDNPAQIVTMGVVPETISRVLAVWKHFSEYGNVFAFKPSFRLADGTLELRPNPANCPEAFQNIGQMLPQLMEDDFFYSRKFAVDLLRPPFVWHLWRSRRRNIPLLLAALTDRIIGGERAFCKVMERNIALAVELYRDPNALDLMEAITRRFAEFCQSRGAVPVLIIIPQLNDLKYVAGGNRFYEPFLERARQILTVVDMTDKLAEPTESNNYINDLYGGHLSPKGNLVVTRCLTSIIGNMIRQKDSTPANKASEFSPLKGSVRFTEGKE